MWTLSEMISSAIVTTITMGVFVYLAFRKKWKYFIKDKVVLVTGACTPGGLGISLVGIAKTYEAKTIIITSRKENDGIEALNFLDGVPGKGNIIHVTLDLNWPDEKIQSVIESVWDKVGGIDVVIASAGVSYRGDLLKTSMEVHKNIMQSNYFGNVSLINSVGNLMKKNKTKDGYFIVGITSIQGRISIPYRSAYSASKHAFSAFLDCLKSEVAKDNIRVLSVFPSYIKTNLSKNALRDSGAKHSKLDETTAKGMNAEEVASAVFSAIKRGDDELALLDLKSHVALYIRTLAPFLYFRIMKKRAEHSKAY